MEKTQYFITSVGEGYKETRTKTTEKVFFMCKTRLYERAHNNIKADMWEGRNDNGMYYERNIYFEFKEKSYMLYILTERKARRGYMLI